MAKTDADEKHQLKKYKNDSFEKKEDAYADAVKNKETTLDNKLKTYDAMVDSIHK